MNILIGEDDNDIVHMYSELLKVKGHSITVADDGEKCLTIYNDNFTALSDQITSTNQHRQHFDVVVLDYKMPKLDGFEVARKIISLNPSQRIILASAYSKDIFDDAADYFNLPIEILQKPFSGSKFVELVENKVLLSRTMA
ncbi:MAG: response regulator [Candidatus Eiseniibacteriota bacterium]